MDLILPSLTLPREGIFEKSQVIDIVLDLEHGSVQKVISWVLRSFPKALTIKGRSKKDPEVFKCLQNFFVQNVIENKEFLPADYKYFGNDNTVETLSHLLLANSFFTNSLLASEKGGKLTYSVISKAKTPEESNFFADLVESLDLEYVRVNAEFDEHMKLVATKCYLKEEIVDMSPEEATAQLLFLFLFYCEAIHATLHIYHMMMVCGMADSAILADPKKKEESEIYKFMNAYFPNVGLKFKEVGKLLLGENAALTGGHWKANRPQVLNALLKIFLVWGECRSAEDYINKFLFRHVPKELRRNVLDEFMKHANLVAPFAKDINEEFRKINHGEDLGRVDKNVKLFFEACGEKASKLENTQEWIEMMSITGLMHSNTLSFSRLMLTAPVLSRFNKEENFGSVEYEAAFNTSGTMIGALTDKVVFNGYHSQEDPNHIDLKYIKNQYYAMSQKLKKEYYLKMKEDKCLVDYGWIHSDYFLDGIDGKYFTITTYI